MRHIRMGFWWSVEKVAASVASLCGRGLNWWGDLKSEASYRLAKAKNE